MKILHLSDEEIQQYAMDRSKCKAEIIEHFYLCEECQNKVADYQFLFTAIKKQPKPSFDFDLSESVLSKLPQTKPAWRPDSFFIYLLVLAGTFLTVTLFYIFRRDLPGLFAGITPLLTYFILTVAATVLAVLGIDMYNTYQKKMNTLDFY